MAEHKRPEIDWAALIAPVVEKVRGAPSLKGKAEWRWGRRQSFCVVLSKGVFHNMETDERGGVLKFLEIELGLKTRADQMKWLSDNGFIEQGERPTSGPFQNQEPAKTYDYVDERGTLLFQVCRFEPGRKLASGEREKKTFLQRKHNKTGGWTWKVAGTRQVPYRLPELLADISEKETIFVVEGEKDADHLRKFGIPATCNAGGAGKWRPELSPYLAGADVVVLEDNDEAGEKHAHAVAQSLSRVAKRVRVLPIKRAWPAVPPKGDVTDWMNSGATPDNLYLAVTKGAVEWEREPFASEFGAIAYRDMDQPWPEHEWLIKKVLAAAEVSLMVGASGSGKTFEAFLLSMTVAASSAGFPVTFHGYKVNRPGACIYQAGESGRGVMKRWRALRDELKLPKDADIPFYVLTLPLNLYASDEDTDKLIRECQAISAQHRQPLELVTIDTLAAATPGANENTSEDMGPVLARCARIARELKCAVLLVHHMNADGHKVRGWTGIQANVDGVIEVSRGGDQEFDEQGRAIRYGKLKKMKDGEDGLSWKFVLKQIAVGKDADGDDVTTCVAVPPALPYTPEEDADKTKHEPPKAKGMLLRPEERPLFRALVKATTEIGVPVPDDYHKVGGLRIPEGATMVRASDWTRYAATVAFDADDFSDRPLQVPGDGALPEKVEDVDRRIRDRLARFGQRMRSVGVLEYRKPHFWITGRPVDGFTFPWLPQPKRKSTSVLDQKEPERHPEADELWGNEKRLREFMDQARTNGALARPVDDDLPI